MGDSFNLEPSIARQRVVEPNEDNLGLTALEKEIVALVVAGYTSKESAEMIGVSQRSLRDHIVTIMTKMGVVKRRLELVLVALHDNLVDPIQYP